MLVSLDRPATDSKNGGHVKFSFIILAATLLVGNSSFAADLSPAGQTRLSYSQSWANKSTPTNITLKVAISPKWMPALTAAVQDWNKNGNINVEVINDTSSECLNSIFNGGPLGHIQLCSGNYGSKPYPAQSVFGISEAMKLPSGNYGHHIISSRINLNDYYFDQLMAGTGKYAKLYKSPRSLLCKYLGHLLGVSTIGLFTKDSCMLDGSGVETPSADDLIILNALYSQPRLEFCSLPFIQAGSFELAPDQVCLP